MPSISMLCESLLIFHRPLRGVLENYHSALTAANARGFCSMSEFCSIYNINSRIRFSNNTAKLTERKLAELSGISRAYAHLLLSSDNMNISVPVIRSLAQTLGVDAYWLETGYGFPYPTEFRVAYPFKAICEDDEYFYHVHVHGELTRMSQSEIESWINIEPGSLPEWLAQYERHHAQMEKQQSAVSQSIAEDHAPYSANPTTSELLSVISQLDAADQERILQEAKDRLLLKKLKEQIDRAQHGGGSEERHCPPIPPRQTKKGRLETA